MGSRLELHALLKVLLGSENVYFQPPSADKMLYPCIRYQLSSIDSTFADNAPYTNERRYQLTVIDRNPDSDIPGKVVALPKCRFDRHFTADGLNHDVFNVYF